MDIKVDADGTMTLRKVYCGVLFESDSGEELGVCMRDSGFEFKYGGEWWEAKNGKVNQLGNV